MGTKTVTRPVEVNICDFCEAEAEHLLECCLCGREGCHAGGCSEHFMYALEVYRYDSSDRIHVHICRECGDTADLAVLKPIMGAPK